jgi:hypothetical protein
VRGKWSLSTGSKRILSQQRHSGSVDSNSSSSYSSSECDVLADMATAAPPASIPAYVLTNASVPAAADIFKQHFERFGKVVEAQIMVDHTSGRSRGFG